MKQIVHANGQVELDTHAEIALSPLYNEDLAPVRVAGRYWNTWDYAALWVSMAHCLPTYYMASGLISNGMSWGQALFTILLGNVIVLAPILLNSHAGTKYGIPFPVFARASYGTIGANLPALMRALVACGWFGIQCWIGGSALQTFFLALAPGWGGALGTAGGYPVTQWISFMLFWAMNIFVIYRGMDLLRRVERWAAPFVIVMTALLVGWALWRANGLGPIIARGGRLDNAGAFFPVFITSLTAMIGFWSTLSLNMPDFTRFGHSQREQTIGQLVALPTTMTVFAGMGVIITSASAIVYGEEIWDPMKLVAKFDNPLVVAVAMITVLVATLSVNIAANVVSPANDFANAFPRLIDFKRGGLITGIIAILMQPWRLLENPDRYINDWLVGYSGGLGSIAAVLIVDYWIVRKKDLSLAALYDPKGQYSRWNVPAVVATLVGTGIAVGGRWIPALRPVYDFGWFAGFGVAGVLYYILMTARPPKTR